MNDPPSYEFTIDESLAAWNVPVQEYLVQQIGSEYEGIATGAIVFNTNGKALLIQRASHDSLPNKWEFPGGAADDDDQTIIHAAARELWEESGLVAKRFTHAISEGPRQEPGEVFRNRARTKTFVRFTFHVEVEESHDVRLDPNEHQDFAWVSEEEIKEGKAGARNLAVTRPSVKALFLEAFRLRRKRLETL